MSYICKPRNIARSEEFDEFYNTLPKSVQDKVLYSFSIIARQKVISTKLVKKIVETEFYELRITTQNAYRIILFSVDHPNIMEAENVLLLNGFVKKSTKDYRKAIEKARGILNKFQL